MVWGRHLMYSKYAATANSTASFKCDGKTSVVWVRHGVSITELNYSYFGVRHGFFELTLHLDF